MSNYDTAILEMLGCIYEDLDIDTVEKKFVDIVSEVFSFDRTALFFVKHKKEVLHGKLSKGFDSEVIKKLEIPIKGNSVFAKPLITGMPLRIQKNTVDTEKEINLLGLKNAALIPIVNKKCVACWEVKNCQTKECPAYGKKWLRCWLVAGTKCNSGSDITAEEKTMLCSKCAVFADLNVEAVEGIMLVDNSISDKPITDDTITILSILAYAVGVAINNSKLYKKTLDVSIRDDLTDLHNRRYFNERLLDEIERAQRYSETVSILMRDIDHFKRVNDTYGHPFGDSVLCWVGDQLQKNLRKTDVISRYGGEEFAILLLNTKKAEASNIAEKIRDSIEKSLFSHLNTGIKITLSFGVATLGNDSNSFEGLLTKVDNALYSAKIQGRNRVCLC